MKPDQEKYLSYYVRVFWIFQQMINLSISILKAMNDKREIKHYGNLTLLM